MTYVGSDRRGIAQASSPPDRPGNGVAIAGIKERMMPTFTRVANFEAKEGNVNLHFNLAPHSLPAITLEFETEASEKFTERK